MILLYFCGGVFMKCEVDYCIYNRCFACTLNETQLNTLGMCEKCMIVSIPDDILQGLKERQLEEIEVRWKE